MDAFDVLCMQLTRDLFAIAKFFVTSDRGGRTCFARVCLSVYLSVCLSVSKIIQKRVCGFG